MQKSKFTKSGFTLIEVIVTLLLVAITAALAGMWIVSVTQGYLLARESASTQQKAQLALTRLVKEFTAISSITASSGAGITFTRTDSNLGVVPVVVSVSGSALQMNVNGAGNNTLTDRVSGFTLQYCDTTTNCGASWSPTTSKVIQITLTLTGANNTTAVFTQRVTPRNI